MEAFPALFSKLIATVFAIAFSICECVNCDLIQMKMQISYHSFLFRLHKHTMSAKFQREKQSPFAIAFSMSYKLRPCHIKIAIAITLFAILLP